MGCDLLKVCPWKIWKIVYSLEYIKCCNVWGSYSGVADNWGLLGYDDVSSG
jgi:hypothetical protein